MFLNPIEKIEYTFWNWDIVNNDYNYRRKFIIKSNGDVRIFFYEGNNYQPSKQSRCFVCPLVVKKFFLETEFFIHHANVYTMPVDDCGSELEIFYKLHNREIVRRTIGFGIWSLERHIFKVKFLEKLIHKFIYKYTDVKSMYYYKR